MVRLLLPPVRKWSGPILTAPEPTRGSHNRIAELLILKLRARAEAAMDTDQLKVMEVETAVKDEFHVVVR